MTATLQEPESTTAEFPELGLWFIRVVGKSRLDRDELQADSPGTQVVLTLHSAEECHGFYADLATAERHLRSRLAEVREEFREHATYKKVVRLRGDLANATERLAKIKKDAANALDAIQAA